MPELKYNDTSEIKIPKTIAEQIIGQDEALKIIKKAALQRRNVLLIGEPGTGKSMLGQALAESLTTAKLADIMCLPNDQDENNPLVRIMPRAKGKELITKLKIQNMASFKNQNIFFFILLIITMITPWWIRKQYGDIIAAAALISSMIFLAAFIIFMNLNKRMNVNKIKVPKLIVDNSDKKNAPFIDATGAHAGALLGDVLHDPLQCYSSVVTILEINTNKKLLQLNEIKVSERIDEILVKYKNKLIKQKDYTAKYLDNNELNILALKENEVQPANVLSINKHKSKTNYLIKLTTVFGKELIVTPEHKVAVRTILNKIRYIRADKIKPWHNLITLE